MPLEIQPREIFYERTGNLSQTTAVNKEVAEAFMRASDLRRDILIVDSDKKPGGSAISVGSDILAWRSIAPISEFTKAVFGRKRFHQTALVDNVYRVQIHDLIIDDDIRQKGYRDGEDYEQKYYSRLRKEVKSATAEVLRWEKLGFKEQNINYAFESYVVFILFTRLFSDLTSGQYFFIPLDMLAPFIIAHPMVNFTIKFIQRTVYTEQMYQDPRLEELHGIEMCLPPIPVHKWIKGRRFLAQYGEELIIPRS